MSFVTVRVNPSEVRLIRESLQELVSLLRAKLLADGYLAEPKKPLPTTIADVSVPTPETIWKQVEEQEKQERRKVELPNLTTGSISPPVKTGIVGVKMTHPLPQPESPEGSALP